MERHQYTARHAGAVTQRPRENMSRRAIRKTATAVLAVIPLLPVLIIARAVTFHIPRLQDYAGVILGLGATLCLLSCLAVTPVSWLIPVTPRGAAAWRRWLGVCVFITGAAGLAVAELGVRTSPAAGMAAAGTDQLWTGTLIVVILLPLALISNRLSQKLLGGWWKTWQRRLTWAAWAVIAVHIVTLAAWEVELAFIAASVPLIAARIPVVRRDVASWRQAGHADPSRWVLAGLAAGVFAYGFVVLTWTEVMCAVQVQRLT